MEKSIDYILESTITFSDVEYLKIPVFRKDDEPSPIQRELEAKKESLKNIFLTNLEKAKEQNKKAADDYMKRLNKKRGL